MATPAPVPSPFLCSAWSTAGASICNQSGNCVPCTDDVQCGEKDSSKPACKTGKGTGECVKCSCTLKHVLYDS